MNIDEKRSIFKVALSDSEDSWKNREIYLVANGYDHAKQLAEEYIEFETVQPDKLLDGDGSLNKNIEKRKMTVKAIQEMFDRVVY